LSASLASAEPVAFGPSLDEQGWKPLTFRNFKPVEYRAEGASRLAIRAESAVSMLWKELPEDFWTKRRATWRWKVDASVPATNLAQKGGDDRAVALYFLFAKDEDSARRAKGASSLTSAVWWSGGAALVYVFGGNGSRNSVVASPHMGASGKLILRQPGGVADGKWIAESADLAADFRRAFGRAPGPLMGVAVSSDSDDTKGTNAAAIEALTLD
jgi:hypothetical protein